MNDFLLYIGRSGLYLSLFYAFYLLVMRHTTLFRFNRVMLLAGSFLCLALPLIRLRTGKAPMAQAGELTLLPSPETATGAMTSAALPWADLLTILYFAGLLAVLVAILVSSGKMLRLIRSGSAEKLEDCRLVVSKDDIPSFTWGRTVVIGRKDLEKNPAILTHERMHVQCRHSLDLLLFAVFQLLFWWNPLVWITRSELKLLHEYEADEGVLKNGIDATQYQLLLVRKSVGEERFSLASGFQHANLKNRITMMLKNPTSGGMRWGYLALLPILMLAMYACNPTKNKNEQADDVGIPYQLVEVKPTFQGGDANNFSMWVNNHLVYPETAKAAGKQGRVTLQFTVDKSGDVTNVKVLKGVDPELDAESLRVVSSCTEKWTPGMQDGKPVDVVYRFPIVYQLK
jgi:TonB family protein